MDEKELVKAVESLKDELCRMLGDLGKSIITEWESGTHIKVSIDGELIKEFREFRKEVVQSLQAILKVLEKIEQKIPFRTV
jgi:hypothetical protein